MAHLGTGGGQGQQLLADQEVAGMETDNADDLRSNPAPAPTPGAPVGAHHAWEGGWARAGEEAAEDSPWPVA